MEELSHLLVASGVDTNEHEASSSLCALYEQARLTLRCNTHTEEEPVLRVARSGCGRATFVGLHLLSQHLLDLNFEGAACVARGASGRSGFRV